MMTIDSVHNWHIERANDGEPLVVTDLVYSPDDGGWYGHQINLFTGKSRNTRRVYSQQSFLEFELNAIGSDGNKKLWRAWR